MAKIEVLSRRDIFSPDPARIGKVDVLTLYRVDGDPSQTFFVTIPKETWNETVEREAIKQAEARRRMERPTSFEI